ncbi:MAG: ATP synthase F1 subunit gamma [Clostridiales bacterium]|nr:ATP synthase F1 subunit gamma [Clostridiales bacterium]
MRSLADIKRRLASVQKTRRITGAMETISTAKMKKALERFESNSAYFDILFGAIRAIANSGDVDVKELIKPPQEGKKLVIVVASDKGLCGSFNHDVFALSDTIIDDETVVMPIGRLAYEHFSRRGDAIDDRFIDEVCAPDYGRAKKFADVVLDEYGKSIKSVRLVYTRLVSRTLWTPKVVELLPLTNDEIGDENSDKVNLSGVEFEPSQASVFKRLFPLYVSGMIYGAFISSATAEHGARQAAMSASSQNADEMIENLSIEYNSARQSAVTEQIIDVVASARAIGKV